jgi:hypothetical protein
MALLALLDAAEFGAEKVRPVWDGLPVPAQREILRLLFNKITVGKPTVVLNRFSTPEARMAAATSRISVKWRKPGTPPVQRQRSTNGGARAQRRRQTRVNLTAAHPTLADPSAQSA